MRLPALALGLLTWTAGIAVPAGYAALISIAAVHSSGYSYSLDDLLHSINKAPGVIWTYSLAMFLIGFMLVLSGFRRDVPDEDGDL